MREGQAGFTLIELLVASVLTTILLVAVLGVIQASSRNLVRNEVPTQQILTQLRHDITNATYYQTQGSQLRLAGPLAQSPERIKLQTFAEIQYSLQRQANPASGQQVLVRRQSSALGDSAEPIWQGVTAIVFEGDEFGDLEATTPVPPELRAQGWKPLPATCRLIIVGMDGEQFPLFIVRG